MYFTAPTYTIDELNTEYKKLCKKLHPDVNGGSETEFKLMKSQYDKIKSEMVNGVWCRHIKMKIPNIVTARKPNNQKYEVTPEDVQAVADFLKTFIDIFNNIDKKKK